MSILDYIGGGKDKVAEFEKLKVGKTPKEIRQLELDLLKPEVLPPPPVLQTGRDHIEERTIKIVFDSLEDLEYFESFFAVGDSKFGKYVRNSSLVIDYLRRGSERIEEVGEQQQGVNPKTRKLRKV